MQQPNVPMQQHVRVLAWLNIVYGGLGILIGLLVFAVLGGISGIMPQLDASAEAEAAAPILVLVGTVVVAILVVVSAPAIVAGLGLLGFRPWAKILTIVLSALHLLSLPFGTALGIYGLWVLLSPGTEPLFRAPVSPPCPNRPCA